MPGAEGRENYNMNGSQNSSEENLSDAGNDGEDFSNNDFKPVSTFNVITTNARSLTPKIESFIEYLRELDTCLAFITEIWLSSSQ